MVYGIDELLRHIVEPARSVQSHALRGRAAGVGVGLHAGIGDDLVRRDVDADLALGCLAELALAGAQAGGLGLERRGAARDLVGLDGDAVLAPESDGYASW